MEKKRYEIEVAGVQLAIISDEREEFVNTVVEIIDKEIKDITAATKRSSNLDAAILCAIQYYSEKVKAEKRARNLEAQIALYDANLRRFREENLALKNKLESANGEKTAEEEPTEQTEDTPHEESAPLKEEKKAEEKPEESAENAGEADGGDARAARLRAIEELLGRGGKKD